jgi:hypothetical protein
MSTTNDAIIGEVSHKSDPLPIACSLDPGVLAARRDGLLGELFRRVARHEELPDGHRFTFEPSSETLTLIARTIDAERQCCRFLTFAVTIEPDLGAFVLDLTGPAGTREFLTDLMHGS